MFGELVPLGGGDPIPLLKKRLVIGRRESCEGNGRLSVGPGGPAALATRARPREAV